MIFKFVSRLVFLEPPRSHLYNRGSKRWKVDERAVSGWTIAQELAEFLHVFAARLKDFNEI